MSSLIKRGSIWYVQRLEWKRYSTGFSRKRDAERELVRTEGKTWDIPDPMLSDQVMSSYLAHKSAEGSSEATLSYVVDKMKPLRFFFGTEITEDSLGSYLELRSNNKVSRHTISKEFQVLRGLIRHMKQDMPVFPKLRNLCSPRRRHLITEDLTKLLAVSSPTLQAFILVAVATSGRLGEVMRWGHEDVDLDRGMVLIHSTKTKFRGVGDRFIPIHKRNEWMIRRAMELPIFTSLTGLSTSLAKAAIKAGLGRISSNDLRRTMPSWLAQAGVSAVSLAKLLGHTSTAMCEKVYIQLDVNHLGTIFDGALQP